MFYRPILACTRANLGYVAVMLKNFDVCTVTYGSCMSSSPKEYISPCYYAGENISSLSPTAHGDLRQQLQASLEAIQESFADYVDCIQESLLMKGVELDKLKVCLIRLPCRDGDWNLTLLSAEKEDIMQATNIYQIFIILDSFTSFLNYHIFEKLVTKFELNNGQEYLKYPDKLQKYIEKHTISEFIEVHPVLNNYNDGTKLVLIMDISLTSKFAKLVNIGHSVAKLMNLDRSTLLIHNIGNKCVIVTFLIPTSVADEIFTGHPTCVFSIDQEEKFRNLSVQQLRCNGYDFDFTSGECGSGKLATNQHPRTLQIDTLELSSVLYSHAKWALAMHASPLD